MKKFLFTLAALFMVGTVCADDYWYIEDFEVPQSAVNTNITVTVKAHFDNAVAAGQIDFTLPEGMVLRKIDRGTDFTTLTYHDEYGDEWIAGQTVFVGATATANVGWAFADMDYYQVDGTWVEAGSVKFMPGEYQNQIVLTIRVNDAFQGGKINVHSEPSCTYDNRPDVVPCPEGQKIDKECTVTLEGATPQLQDLTGNIVVSQPDDNGVVTVSYTGTEDVTITVNGEPVAASYQLEDGVPMTFNVTVSAEGYNDLTAEETRTWNKPQPKDLTGNIVVSQPDDNGVVTVTYTGPEEVTITVNGQPVAASYQLEDGVPMTFNVTVSAEGYNDLEASETRTWTKPGPKDLTGEIVVSEPDANGVVTVTYTGTEEVTILVNDEPVAESYQLEDGVPMTFNVVVSAEGYNDLTANETRTWNKPEPQETTTFVKVTAADQLVAGKNYIIVAGNKAMGVEATGNFLTAIDITAGDEVEVGDNVAIMTLAGTTGHFTLALGEQYLHAVNSTNLNFGTATEWAIADYNGTLDGYRVKHADYNRAVRYSAGYDRFGNYSTTDENSVYGWIYVEKTDAPALQDLTGEIVVSEPDANGVVTVTYTGTEEVTITVNGEPVAASYQLEDGVPMTFNVVVSAEGYNDLEASETRTWTKPADPELPGNIIIGTPDANGNFYVNYMPGDYEGDYTMTVTINGETVEPNEDGTYPAVEGHNEVVVTVTAPGYQDKTKNAEFDYSAPKPAPAPTFAWDEETLTMTATCEGHTVTLYANGTEVANPYTATKTYQEQQITFSAQTQANEGESGPSAVVYYAENPVIIPALEKTPSEPATFETKVYDTYVEVYAYGPNVVLYDENNQEVDPQPYVIQRPAYDPEGSSHTYVGVSATTQNDGEQYAPTTTNYTVDVPMQAEPTPELKDLEGHIVFSAVNQADGSYTVTYDGPEEGVVVTVISEIPKNRTADALPDYGTYTVTAKASKEGYNDLVESAELTWTKPVIGAPTFQGYSQDGITGYGVNITPTTTGSEIMYVVYIYNEETKTWDALTDWTEYEGTENEIWYTEEGKYKVDAYAYIGQNQSEIVSYEFTVIPATPTSIDEMNAGKSIAGVRYFNMAGQEMQEANGVTIVVTTYTDGTTSAVKVMK